MRPPGYETLDRRGANRPYESMALSGRAAGTAPDGIPVRLNASYPGRFMTPDGVLHQHGALPTTACTCAFTSDTRGAAVRRASRLASPAHASPADADVEQRQMRLRLLELSRIR